MQEALGFRRNQSHLICTPTLFPYLGVVGIWITFPRDPRRLFWPPGLEALRRVAARLEPQAAALLAPDTVCWSPQVPVAASGASTGVWQGFRLLRGLSARHDGLLLRQGNLRPFHWRRKVRPLFGGTRCAAVHFYRSKEERNREEEKERAISGKEELFL
jgi:hypothetical protein